MNKFEDFATKGIQRNLKASRTLDDPGSYYPITHMPNDAHRGSNPVLAVFLIGIALGVFFTVLLSNVF